MLNLSPSVYRYQPDMERDLPVITAIQAVLEINLGYGFGKLFKTMRRQGYRWNYKRVYRAYCLLKLNKRRKVRILVIPIIGTGFIRSLDFPNATVPMVSL